MFRSLSRSLLWGGLLAVAIGIVAIVWPGVTIGSVVVIFSIAAFIGAFNQGARAFSSGTAGPVAGHLLLGLIDVVAAVGALVWPGITAYALTIWVGAWAVVTGVGEFGMAFQANETTGERATFGFGGLLSIALGAVLFARPDVGAVALAQVFGLFALTYGFWGLVLAARTHHAVKEADSALRTRSHA